MRTNKAKLVSIFDKTSSASLTEFVTLCSKYVKFDRETFFQLAQDAIRYYKGNKSLRDRLRKLQTLEEKWYKSLDKGTPNYALYGDNYILADIWACWIVYSRNYLLNIQKDTSLHGVSIVSDMKNVRSVVDLGCGFGYTTAALKELFPKANVYGTNLEGTCQFNVASEVGEQRGFSLRSDIDELDSVDLVFASEYFEHIERPLEHLESIIANQKPKYFITANAFNSVSMGHFREFKHHKEVIDCKAIGKRFNATMRSHGYEKVKTGCWNDRPAYWRKQ